MSEAKPVQAAVSAGEIAAFEVARIIDHTILKTETTRDAIIRLCDEGVEFGFATVCVNPVFVSLVAQRLRGTQVKAATVAGFPLGATLTEAKVKEAEAGLRAGAREIDMVQSVGLLKSSEYRAVEEDIREVAAACHGEGAILKVILEMGLLAPEEKIRACQIAHQAGADFVKTCTGFGTGNATVEDVKLMRHVVGPSLGVKASSGVRTLESLRALVAAGATRIGTSAGVSIVQQAMQEPGSRKSLS
jgi:deoxyribose-phosphate aldolase